MKTKFLFLFMPFILVLAACSPAATPSAPIATAAEVVVVTQVVEVEGEEVVSFRSEPGNPAQLIAVQPANRMVIKDAEMDLLVRDTDYALTMITQMAADYGGYIISSQTWYDGGFKYATLRLAVPSSSFETALNNLRILGLQVLRETASGQDVSAEYVDLQTRLTNLEATAARVREFLAEAKTVEESLKVSAELSELEGQIEQIKGQMRYYEGRTAFSTVTVLLTPERPTPTPAPTPTATPGWSPGQTFENASDTLVTLTQGTIDALIWFTVVIGPFLLVMVAVVWSWRTSRRGSKS